MTVGTISGAGAAAPAAPAKSERVETHENDGDGDDAKGASAPARSVNLNGQTTGTTIHAVWPFRFTERAGADAPLASSPSPSFS